jgi:soluble lytic murein transglycosylase-like protein
MDSTDNLSIQARLDLVSKYAVKYSLEASLVCGVVEQESAWNQYAIRYEPAFFARYVQPQNHEITEGIARSISWGLMQTIGQVVRELGFTGHLASLCDPSIGLDYGCQILKRGIDQANGDITGGLLHYNGGGNKDYPTQVLARVPRYQLTPQSDS